MKAVRKLAAGPGHIVLCDIPEPGLESPDQVKIAVKAGGICGTDLHIRQGGYGFRPPVTLGHEFSGEIVAAGPAVRRVKPGDRVAVMPSALGACGTCRYCRTGSYFFCPGRASLGSIRDGGFAEFCIAPEHLVFPLPAHVGCEAAALIEPLACCVKAVCQHTRIAPGDLVLISGPGPIGLMCAVLAGLHGANVLVCGTPADGERLRVARELGIPHTLNIGTENLIDAVGDLSGGHGADVVLECGGSPASVDQCLDAVAIVGQYTQVALIDHPITVDFGKIIYKQLRVAGSIATSWPAWDRALDLVCAGVIVPERFVTHRLPLENWETAFDVAEGKQGLKHLLIP